MFAGIEAQYVWFFGLIVLSLVMGETPLRLPFKWAETFYHELSHGIAALLTFGRVHKLHIDFNGGGACTTSGGFRPFILLMGYAGASMWGGLLYFAGWKLGDSGAAWWLQFELGLIAVVVLLWVRDLKTLVILACVAAVYGLGLKYRDAHGLYLLLQYTGIYVMMNAIRAPLYLIDGKHVGDGADLADIFIVLPEGFWILLWWLWALFVLGACGYYTLPGAPELVWYYTGI